MEEAQTAFARALELFGQADFESAEERLRELIAAQPEHAEAWAYLGLCRLESGFHREGLEALERAAKLAPDNADIHYWLGNAAGALGQLDRALAGYQRALEINPAHVKAGEFHVRTRTLLASRDHYRAALTLLEARRRGHAPAPDRSLAQALRELLQSIALFAGSPARDELAYCAREILRVAPDLHLTVAATPEFANWARLAERGYQNLKLLNFTGAAQAYEEALGYRPDDLVTLHGLALALAAAGQAEAAARAWLDVLEREPEFDFARLPRVHLAPRTQQ